MNRRYQGRPPRRGGRHFFHNSRRGFVPRGKPVNNKPQQSSYDKAQNYSYSRDTGSEPMIRLKENEVGITEFISDHQGFNGVIKQRYSDFHVNEIDCEGNIVTLTSMEPPDITAQSEEEEPGSEEHLKSIVSPEVFEKIKNIIEESESSTSTVDIDVTEMGKDDRRQLHCAVKAVGRGRLVSNTTQKEEQKYIVVSRHNRKVKSHRESWPARYDGDYVHFVLHKQNLDTMETVNFLANKLRIKPNMITYAGTKDRRGVTSQLMSIWHVDPRTLAELNANYYSFFVGNYTFKSKALKLGDLRGNRFRIVLRNVTGSDDQIQQALTSLSEKGFINYYGLQRFGTSVEVPTYAIGRALLQGNWKLAVELILKPRQGEQNRDLAKARRIWWETRNAKQALDVLPKREKLIEAKLLYGLSRSAPNDYVSALERIPRNTRLLYLHSYQSLVWNKVVSRRVKELGIKPVVGDLVFMGDVQTDTFFDEAFGEEGEESEILLEANAPRTDVEKTKQIKKDSIKILTEDDVSSVNMHDIVMPLPGHDVIYPNNIMKEWYEEILKMDDLSSAKLKQSVRKYSVSGDYRKMVIRPEKLSWKTMRYSSPYKDLEISDRDKMENKPSPEDEPNGTYKAILLDFCLPSSTYATMALREILKADTSSEHQASLNEYASQKNDEKSDSTSKGEEQMACTSTNSSEATESGRILGGASVEASHSMEVESEAPNEHVSKLEDNENQTLPGNEDVSESKISDNLNDKIVTENDVLREGISEQSSEKRQMEDGSDEVEKKKIKLS